MRSEHMCHATYATWRRVWHMPIRSCMKYRFSANNMTNVYFNDPTLQVKVHAETV